MTQEKRIHFIRQMIQNELDKGIVNQVVTRFPPEPNGYLHIGHARAIYTNFSMAEEFNGVCHLRFDDTNPEKEDIEYINAISEDIHWLGFKWHGQERYTSSYYDELYQLAESLIEKDLAYIDSLSIDEIRAYRGTLTEPGKNSPYRNRDKSESLKLFREMKAGKYQDGEYVLRAKIDMASPNINMRDPVIYRIKHHAHPKTGDKWCIYPMYDYAHPLSDAIEGITHSLCSLEFQDHRPLYDWLVENTDVVATPKQTEFSRLNLSHTITSKRKLKQLVDENKVSGWNDPRMPTLSGLRNRGVPASAICDFCELTGLSKSDSITDLSLLEECIRETYNESAKRAMAVLDPIKVTITNYPEGESEALHLASHPKDETLGTRQLHFSKTLYIDREDFMEVPENKFFRLAPGKEVRLRGAYVVKCESFEKDDNGNIKELFCTYDKDTLGKKPEGRKVKGVIHWLPENEALNASITLFDRLFKIENPAKAENFLDELNPDSKKTIEAFVEPSLKDAKVGDVFQFERLGYFILKQTAPLSFYRVVTLKDTWKNK